MIIICEVNKIGETVNLCCKDIWEKEVFDKTPFSSPLAALLQHYLQNAVQCIALCTVIKV